MPYCCCVPYCRSSNRSPNKVSFHQIPADIDRRILWLEAIGRKGTSEGSQWIPNQYDVVCGKHFKQDDYKQGDNIKTRHKILKKDAVPSIFENSTYPLAKKSKECLVKVKSNITSTELSYKSESSRNRKAKKVRLCLVKTESRVASARKSCRPELLENDKGKKSRQCLVAESTKDDKAKKARQYLVNTKSKSISSGSSYRPESFENGEVLCHNSTPTSSPVNTLSLHPSVFELKEENAALKQKLKMAMSKLIEAGQTIKKLHKEKKLLLEQNAKLSADLIELLGIKNEPVEGS